jgi:hypothetical protein
MTLQNEKFEEMVSRQLTAELEPQRGKALAAFRAHMLAEQAARPGGPAPIPIAQGRSRRTLALWAGVPSVLAACVAVAVTLHLVDGGRNVPVNPDRGVASSQAAPGGTGSEVASAGGSGAAEVVKTASLPPNTGTIVFDSIVTGNVPGNIVITNDHTPAREVNYFEQRPMVGPNGHSATMSTEPPQGFLPVRPF